jgi:low affinity Fe/Cu permease
MNELRKPSTWLGSAALFAVICAFIVVAIVTGPA